MSWSLKECRERAAWWESESHLPRVPAVDDRAQLLALVDRMGGLLDRAMTECPCTEYPQPVVAREECDWCAEARVLLRGLKR